MILDLLLDVAIFAQYAVIVSLIPTLFARSATDYIGIFLISFCLVGGPSAMLALFVLVSSVVTCAMAYDAIRGGRRLVLA